ncbi:hypothetical protein [Goodfellowiella coeruleoviolacea]|uniref:SH3 domain-containing protein n=1 Tax=Goodfellowiella coeruleoviolacea TaxID=334858 RepID=A0AAE3GC02_9PSEU|nr:hypothetical protein [Goodfellowiella coeruleoviolacea]MCP2163378.1 hypothetical protein [Goodfellowiella coeruleoviolacea]
MKRPLLSITAVVGLALLAAAPAASAAPTTQPGDVGVLACSSAPRSPSNKDTTVGAVKSGHNAPIRRGPYGDCDPPLLYAGAGTALDYWCYVSNSYSNTWTFVTEPRTGVTGWVYDDHLTGNGSSVPC